MSSARIDDARSREAAGKTPANRRYIAGKSASVTPAQDERSEFRGTREPCRGRSSPGVRPGKLDLELRCSGPAKGGSVQAPIDRGEVQQARDLARVSEGLTSAGDMLLVGRSGAMVGIGSLGGGPPVVTRRGRASPFASSNECVD